MAESTPYTFIEPKSPSVPILISSPHSGTAFPSEIKSTYKEALIEAPEDTDWFMDQLYDFAPSMGISMITAKYSRWVIDLNRNPDSKPLYNDGRLITGLCTHTTFEGADIYKDQTPDQVEIERRLKAYYWPYYQKIQSTLDALKAKFGHVLLYDAHSIKQYVSTIRKENFPDLILGTADETSADPAIIQTALEGLSAADYELTHNTPFKGGHITRYFGKPSENQHALQLERAKMIYMDDTETAYHPERAEQLRNILKRTFTNLIAVLQKL